MQRGSTTEDENVVAALYSPLIKGGGAKRLGVVCFGNEERQPPEGSATLSSLRLLSPFCKGDFRRSHPSSGVRDFSGELAHPSLGTLV